MVYPSNPPQHCGTEQEKQKTAQTWRLIGKVYNSNAKVSFSVQSLQKFDAKERHLHFKNRWASFWNRLKSLFSFFCNIHAMMFSKYALELRFQNLLFQKLSAKRVLFPCEREAYPWHLSPLQSVLASFKRNLIVSNLWL